MGVERPLRYLQSQIKTTTAPHTDIATVVTTMEITHVKSFVITAAVVKIQETTTGFSVAVVTTVEAEPTTTKLE